MDVFSTLDHQISAWDHGKAASNLRDTVSASNSLGKLFWTFRVCTKLPLPRPRQGGQWNPQKGNVVKTVSERIRRAKQPERPMTLISFRLPDCVIEDLKEVAAAPGFGENQALIRAYISNGIRKHLAKFEGRHIRENAVAGFWQRLFPEGVSDDIVQKAAAEMQAATS